MPKKDQTAVMCHNIAKYNREHQESEMTPLEAAEKLKNIENHAKGLTGEDLISLHLAYAAMSKIASGEYAPVVHGHWIRKYDTLSQNYNSAENWYYVCSECGGADTNRAKRCSSCGALMDESRDGNSHNGKDDSHE